MKAAPTIKTSNKVSPAIIDAVRRVADAARVRRLRTMRQFAESELVLPSGPFMGERFKVSRQPWTGLWLDAVDSGRWRRFNLTGPSQAGKTLAGSALPVLYHLLEVGETVIYAAPTLEMAADKWREDIFPLIEASGFRDLLPERGASSKGGAAAAITFKHGPTLRFMTGGGSDKTRAGFTSRIVVITETDGMDEAGGSSREGDKISQLEARSNAFGDRARTYLECTVSTESGRTWKELKEGTDSRIVLPCPHCGEWTTPDRDQLTGWQDAESVSEAGQRATLCCPACGAAWSELERADANRLGVLVHRSQSVDRSGTIQGMVPATHTLGFRFTATNNLFATMAHVAEAEWAAPRQGDASLGEKSVRQFTWAMPSEAETIALTQLDVSAIIRRAIDVPRGRVPGGTQKLTVGVDIGKWLAHWVAVAWSENGEAHVCEYGRIEVPSQSMAEEQAILNALRRFRDEICAAGWPNVDAEQPNMRASLAVFDSGYSEAAVVAFTMESGAGCIASKGFGARQVSRKTLTSEPGYEAVQQPGGHVLAEINADHWKSFVHARLQTPAGSPGGLTLFHASAVEHLSFSKHLTAEKKVEEFISGRGLVTRWEVMSRSNHYLDALALACCAGHAVGVRIVTPAPPPPPPEIPVRPRPQGDRDFPKWLNHRPPNMRRW